MRRHHQKESQRDQNELVGGPHLHSPSGRRGTWAAWLQPLGIPAKSARPFLLPFHGPQTSSPSSYFDRTLFPKVEVKVVAMQKALLVASRSNLFSHFGGGAAAVSVKLQNKESRVAWKGMVTKAGQQVEQAGEDPKVEDSPSDGEESRMHPHTRKAYRDDMEESYGVGYATRASDMGYGERYGEAVKAVLDKKAAKREGQRGATSDRDQHADAFLDAEYDTTQGEPVAQKEVGRHSQASDAFESERAVHEEVIIHEEKIVHKEKTVLD